MTHTTPSANARPPGRKRTLRVPASRSGCWGSMTDNVSVPLMATHTVYSASSGSVTAAVIATGPVPSPPTADTA